MKDKKFHCFNKTESHINSEAYIKCDPFQLGNGES